MSNPTALVQKLWNYCNMGSLAPARSGLRPFARRPTAQVSAMTVCPTAIMWSS